MENKDLSSEEVGKKRASKAEAVNDEIVRAFDPVLDEDEKIVKAIKPHKGKVYFSRLMTFGLPLLLFLGLMLLAICLPDENGEALVGSELVVAAVVVSAVFVLGLVLCLVFTWLYVKHTIYVVTNKRVVIRTGIIGVDFKSLDLKNIGASDVYVSLLDKMLQKNTGTLRFGSASSPMTANNTYVIAHVQNPYELYKEIKSYISSGDKTEK